MAALRIRWQIGSSVTGKAITPLTLETNLTLTPGTSLSLEQVLDRFGFQGTNVTEKIVGMDVNLDNQVIVERTNSLTLEEIMQSGTESNLAKVAEGYDYALFTWTEQGKTKSFYGVVLSGGEDKVKGKNIYRLELGPIVLNNSGNPVSNFSVA